MPLQGREGHPKTSTGSPDTVRPENPRENFPRGEGKDSQPRGLPGPVGRVTPRKQPQRGKMGHRNQAAAIL